MKQQYEHRGSESDQAVNELEKSVVALSAPSVTLILPVSF